MVYNAPERSLLMTPKSSPVPIYGDVKWRGKCPTEAVEQASFFNKLRAEYPETWGRLALHIRNEGKRTAQQMRRIKSEGGFVSGASDIIIPARVSFVCEMKRRDITQSSWQPGQQDYLVAAQNSGAFTCVALGAVGAWEAFEAWRKSHE